LCGDGGGVFATSSNVLLGDVILLGSIGRNRLFWIAAALGLALDRVSKLWIMETFTLGQSKPFLPGILQFTYVVNEGAAFSLFRGAGWLPWLSLLASVAIVVYVTRSSRLLSQLQKVGWGLVLSGAFGNGIDRFLFRHVVDFLDLRFIQFAVFNLADAFINIGVICLFIEMLRLPSVD
jgi:signal peptidase II